MQFTGYHEPRNSEGRSPRLKTIRTRGWGYFLIGLVLSGCSGPVSEPGHADLMWGRPGRSEGRLYFPRAMAIDDQDQLYVVDKTGRIQVFSTDGQFLRGWRTPQIEQGKPCGLTIGQDRNLLVADTHYFRVLTYSTLGTLLTDRTLGGANGSRPGEFNFVTDVVQDTAGRYYVSEYGDFDRVQKFDRDGKFLLQWGGHGSLPGQFVQPRGLAIDAQNRVWVADACNHRIQVFDATGDQAKLLQVWGEQGSQPGQLKYPFGLALDGQGHLYVADRGNCRVQKFTLAGQYLAHWGSPGRREGELNEPWGVVLDSRGRVHVLDTNNHRVQRVHF